MSKVALFRGRFADLEKKLTRLLRRLDESGNSATSVSISSPDRNGRCIVVVFYDDGVPPKHHPLAGILREPVSVLGVSPRCMEILKRFYDTVRDVAEADYDFLSAELGPKLFRELRRALKVFGLRVKGDPKVSPI